jgi:hypothetical protein
VVRNEDGGPVDAPGAPAFELGLNLRVPHSCGARVGLSFRRTAIARSGANLSEKEKGRVSGPGL